MRQIVALLVLSVAAAAILLVLGGWLVVSQQITLGQLVASELAAFESRRIEQDTQMRMLCVFNPPVTGREVHDENGVYPLVEVPA